MAYINGFPATYQQMYPQYQQYIPQMPVQQTAQPTQGIIWTQGKVGAQSYAVGAGQSVILMDSDGPYVYKKETAVDWRPMPMETYRLVREEDGQDKPVVSEDELKNYVKADQIEEIVTEKIEDIVRDEVDRRLSELSFKPTSRKARSMEE